MRRRQAQSGYHFGRRSIRKLKHVHPHLVLCAGYALEHSPVDFGVYDGVRTLKQQKQFVADGVSWTLKSKHLLQSDGLGHALDLVPYIGGQYRWDSTTAFIEIGELMREAAALYRVKIKWLANVEHGGDWKNGNDMAHFSVR